MANDATAANIAKEGIGLVDKIIDKVDDPCCLIAILSFITAIVIVIIMFMLCRFTINSYSKTIEVLKGGK